LELFKDAPYSFETDAPHCVELTMYEQQADNRYILNLLNRQEVLPSVPVYDIAISVSVPQSIKAVRLLPEEIEIPFMYQDGQVSFTLDKVDIFRMVALDY